MTCTKSQGSRRGPLWQPQNATNAVLGMARLLFVPFVRVYISCNRSPGCAHLSELTYNCSKILVIHSLQLYMYKNHQHVTKPQDIMENSRSGYTSTICIVLWILIACPNCWLSSTILEDVQKFFCVLGANTWKSGICGISQILLSQGQKMPLNQRFW